MNFKLSPSILAADFAHLGEQVDKAEQGGAKYVHLDVMDGKFVPNFTFGATVIKSLRKSSDLFFDCHLMVENPYDFIDDCYKAGVDNITIHYESLRERTGEALKYIKSLGIKAGLSVSPDTDVEVVREYLPDIDMILIMSVYPGFGGQKFIEKSLEKLSAARKMADEYSIDVEVDGGVNFENIKTIYDAGANVIVAGSAVFGADDIAEATRKLIAQVGDDK
jgi:ribulose-phosphate 3-epimerase